MRKQAIWQQVLALTAVAALAAADSSEPSVLPEDSEAAEPVRVSLPAISTFFRDLTAVADANFEYKLHPFSRSNFASRTDFEEFMDNLGARGFGSVFHFANNVFDPADDTRVFMRAVGGSPTRTFDHSIERYRIDPGGSADVWVDEWDRLGARGGILVFLFREGGQWYAVTEATLLDGELQTWSWARRQAGPDSTPTIVQWKRAAKKLARRGYIPRTIGLSADRSKFYVVGIKNTTPDRGEVEIKLRFREISLTSPEAEWKRHVKKQGKKGYLLVAVELNERRPTDFLMVFARETIDDRRTNRLGCLLEPVLLSNQPRLVERLNAHGAKGLQVIFTTNVGSFESPTHFLCDPEEER